MLAFEFAVSKITSPQRGGDCNSYFAQLKCTDCRSQDLDAATYTSYHRIMLSRVIVSPGVSDEPIREPIERPVPWRRLRPSFELMKNESRKRLVGTDLGIGVFAQQRLSVLQVPYARRA